MNTLNNTDLEYLKMSNKQVYLQRYQVETTFTRSYAKDITIINGLMIKHSGSNIKFAKCMNTGKFVKHSIALSSIMFSKNEMFKTKLVLSFCVLINVLAAAYVVLGSV